VLSIVSVYVNSLSHLEGVSARLIGCSGVAVYVVIRSVFSCVFEYRVVYSFRDSQGSGAMLTNGFPETRVEI